MQPDIVCELTNVIREWGANMKELYVSRDPNFETIEKYINKLIKYRSEILTGQLLTDQQNAVLKMAILDIDVGNKEFDENYTGVCEENTEDRGNWKLWTKVVYPNSWEKVKKKEKKLLLGLDMVVRDERGNILSTLYTPTFQLYRSHVTTAARIKSPYTVREYKNSINVNHKYCAYLPLQHKNQLSLIQNVDLVRSFYKDISPSDVAEYISLMILNEDFLRGDDIINLLNWISCPDKLLESLSELKKLKGEVLVFLHDILNALFNIYESNLSIPSNSNSNIKIIYELVFNCLIYIIELISDENCRNFQPVLELYIEKYFDSKLAHNKLMSVFIRYLNDLNHIDNELLFNTVKSFKYIMKFITKSKLLCSESILSNEHDIFENSIHEMLKSILNLIRKVMTFTDNEYFLIECIKCVPQSTSDIVKVFSATRLSSWLVELIDSLSSTTFVDQQLSTMNDIVHSQIFTNADCRSILIPCIVMKVRDILLHPGEDTTDSLNCVKLFGDIMDMLYVANPESTLDDIHRIMMTNLDTLVQILKVTDRNDQSVKHFACILISILRQMTNFHFETYIMHFTTKTHECVFLKEILLIFKNLVCWPIFPKDWCEMTMLQNSVILKSLGYFSHVICEHFFEDFDCEVWTAFFHCAFAFMMQPCLQLEKFSINKRSRIISAYNDMRIEAESLILTTWMYLGQHKFCLMPYMVGPFLEMSLISENEIRRTTIPIFFDMMQCEFYSFADNNANTDDSCNIKSNFDVFENKMIKNLDYLIANGKGDEQFKEFFKTIMLDHCENDYAMIEQSVKFVEKFIDQLEWLLEYHTGINGANRENMFYYTVNLLNYYKEIKQHELIIKYLNKMYFLNSESSSLAKADLSWG